MLILTRAAIGIVWEPGVYGWTEANENNNR
jgi:hypothetical protein